MRDLKNRVALVTGASSGIGEAVAIALSEAGVNVALTARRGERLTALAERISATGKHALALAGDITDEVFATHAVNETARHFGRLDILVNAAGVMPEGGVEKADFTKWHRVMNINLHASLYTSSAAIEIMRPQKSGDIINISSTAGRRASGLFGAYSTSKFGLNALTESMRQQVGAYGIRVCTLAPGATDTALWENIEAPELRQSVQKRAQRPDAMKPQDIAEAVLFVASLPQRVNISEMLIRPTSDVAPI